MKVYQCSVEIDEYTYDRDALEDLYNKFVEAGCLQKYGDYIAWQNPALKGKFSNLPGMMAINPELIEGKKLVEYEPVATLFKLFNFEVPLAPYDVDFVTYEPGYEFGPHVDHAMQCGIMFPIIPTENYSPISFYELPGVNCVHRVNYIDMINRHGRKLYDHEYSHKHPTLFNGKQLHGVPRTEVQRAYLRFKIKGESFASVLSKLEAGTFLNV